MRSSRPWLDWACLSARVSTRQWWKYSKKQKIYEQSDVNSGWAIFCFVYSTLLYCKMSGNVLKPVSPQAEFKQNQPFFTFSAQVLLAAAISFLSHNEWFPISAALSLELCLLHASHCVLCLSSIVSLNYGWMWDNESFNFQVLYHSSPQVLNMSGFGSAPSIQLLTNQTVVLVTYR